VFVLTKTPYYIGEKMKKLGIAGLIVLLLAIILVTSTKVTELERSPMCDQYKVSFNTPLYISDACIKNGK